MDEFEFYGTVSRGADGTYFAHVDIRDKDGSDARVLIARGDFASTAFTKVARSIEHISMEVSKAPESWKKASS